MNLATRLPCLGEIGAILCAATLALRPAPGSAGELATVVLGDSLSAEYEATPHGGDFGVSDTLAENWVEILGAIRSGLIQFGSRREFPAIWDQVRLHGYKHNWAYYGWKTSDLAAFLASDDWEVRLARAELDQQLRADVGRVVIFAGGNDANARYGDLYGETALPAGFLEGLLANITYAIDYVRAVNPALAIVVVNIPDVGVTPDVRGDVAYPDPFKRGQASALIAQINAAIAGLEADPPAGRAVAVADVASLTGRLASGDPIHLGAIRLVDDADPENDPRHLFTNDGFHPNTCAQIFVARAVIDAFNRRYGAGIPTITEADALAYLGLDPDLPYLEWIAGYPVTETGMEDDPEGDGVVNLAEYALGRDPSLRDAGWTTRVALGSRGGTPALEMVYRPDPERLRHVRLTPFWSGDLVTWEELPGTDLVDNGDGSISAWLVARDAPGFLCLRARRLAPDEAE